MPRIKVVRRIHEYRLGAMAFVLGLTSALLARRLSVGIGFGGAPTGLGLTIILMVAPLGFALPFFDQRFKTLAWYVAVAVAGSLLALVAERPYQAPAFLVIGGPLFLVLWFVGLLVTRLGVLASRACYRLVIQDGTLCPGCGYKLIGLTSQVCPECGRPFTYEELGTTRQRLQAAAKAEEPDESG